MMMMMMIKANLQMPILWKQVKSGCGEMNDDDDDDNNNESESPDADMVAASKHWV